MKYIWLTPLKAGSFMVDVKVGSPRLVNMDRINQVAPIKSSDNYSVSCLFANSVLLNAAGEEVLCVRETTEQILKALEAKAGDA